MAEPCRSGQRVMRLSPGTLTQAMRDVSVAYYLIHGKQGGQINANRDLDVARNFAEAAAEANIERIIYLGELVDPTTNLSPYLRARHETGYILRYSQCAGDRIPRGHDRRFWLGACLK